MPKKMKTPSLFKNKDPKQPWQWPSCNNPKTLSFRASNDYVFKTVNSVFLDTSDGLATPNSWFTNSSSDSKALEMIIRGGRSSERLFFEPGDTSSRILDKEPASSGALEESVALAVESDDPYMDFKTSMHEMVESHGMEEWDRLEELLGWYLKMNAKHNHGFIVGAFVDLLVGMATDSTLYSSADSSFSSPVCCRDDIDVQS
ncbi:transcription repressor OFP13-like [Salvia divinorum]|uniref:Transcription repressor n=1 Tax=Salvia divinorum TaxID=28513 RepID=A0ABD1GZS1_SALDI